MSDYIYCIIIDNGRDYSAHRHWCIEWCADRDAAAAIVNAFNRWMAEARAGAEEYEERSTPWDFDEWLAAHPCPVRTDFYPYFLPIESYDLYTAEVLEVPLALLRRGK